MHVFMSYLFKCMHSQLKPKTMPHPFPRNLENKLQLQAFQNISRFVGSRLLSMPGLQICVVLWISICSLCFSSFLSLLLLFADWKHEELFTPMLKVHVWLLVNTWFIFECQSKNIKGYLLFLSLRTDCVSFWTPMSYQDVLTPRSQST